MSCFEIDCQVLLFLLSVAIFLILIIIEIIGLILCFCLLSDMIKFVSEAYFPALGGNIKEYLKCKKEMKKTGGNNGE